jgi:metal-responsive CopG/Arc/MetJ family transcriptional regulator
VKTIQMTIDEPLLKAVDRVSRARKTTRSAFIRYAVEAELRREQIQVREAQDAAGYARHPVKKGEFDIPEKEQDWGPE